jgi:hypothetical protein
LKTNVFPSKKRPSLLQLWHCLQKFERVKFAPTFSAAEKIAEQMLSSFFYCNEETLLRLKVWVARWWYISRPKIPIWVNFGGPCHGRCWRILWPFGQFSGLLLYFTVI